MIREYSAVDVGRLVGIRTVRPAHDDEFVGWFHQRRVRDSLNHIKRIQLSAIGHQPSAISHAGRQEVGQETKKRGYTAGSDEPALGRCFNSTWPG